MPSQAGALAVLALLTLCACATTPSAGVTMVNEFPEDFEHDPINRRLIVASKPPVFVPINEDGTLGTVVAALEKEPENLRMVGISLTPDGQWLYAINRVTRLIDVFKVSPTELVFDHSLPPYEKIRNRANEVFAVRKNQVYVSNGQGSRRPLLEMLFKRPQANVLYFDGGRWREVATGIRFGNGMQISADEKTFYVAGFQDKAIHVYKRAEDGSLTPNGRIAVCGSPDNLKWTDAERTKLLVPAHRSSFRTFLHLLLGGRTSASSEVQTVAVPPAAPEVTIVYPTGNDTGREIHTASTAMLNGKNLYISQIVKPYLYHSRIERERPCDASRQ